MARLDLLRGSPQFGAAAEAGARIDECYDRAMQSVKVSSKHQISLPSTARRHLGIEPGDRLSVEVTEDALILRIRPDRPSERLRGLGAKAWSGVDPVAHVRALRDEDDTPR